MSSLLHVVNVATASNRGKEICMAQKAREPGSEFPQTKRAEALTATLYPGQPAGLILCFDIKLIFSKMAVVDIDEQHGELHKAIQTTK